MANRSRVIMPVNENSHRSKLIKSFQSIENLEDFKTKPEGVWGSTATISILYEYDSGSQTIKNTLTFESDKLDFEFTIPFDDDLETNEGEIIIYNLSKFTVNELSAIIKYRKARSIKEKVTITAGYEGDTGVIFQGYMTKVSTKQENADKVTTIKVVSDIEVKENLELSRTGSAQAILTELLGMLEDRTHLAIAKKNFKRDYTYSNSQTIDGSLEEAIKKYSEVCGVSTIINKGNIYCCKLNEIDDVSIFNVSEDTGMIGSPQPFSEEVTAEEYTEVIEGFEIDMLLQHRMGTGAVINLSSKGYSGTYYVQSGTFTFNQSESTTHIRVIEVV